MPLDITFTLSDEDLDHFQKVVDRSKDTIHRPDGLAYIETSARKLIETARAGSLPVFVSERLEKLEILINMVGDKEWKLSEEERQNIIGAMAYFCDPDDMIADDIPGLGFLDDAIYVEIIIKELQAEIDSYTEFCAYRTSEEQRRINEGLDPNVDRESWLKDQRAVLHSRMRSRRRARAGSGSGWRMRLW